MFDLNSNMKGQLGLSPQLPGTGNVTRFAGQALGEPRQQPLEVQFGSKKDLRNPQMGMIRDRGSIQSNLAGPSRELKSRASIQANQTPGGDLEPTKLEGFGS